MEFLLIRAIERLIAVLVGAFAIYLGYRLFLAVKTTGEGSAQVKLPYDVTVMVSRVGPGVFFALFGSALIGISLSLPVRYNEMESRAPGGGVVWHKDVSGMGADPSHDSDRSVETPRSSPKRALNQETLEQERLRAREHIGFLNRSLQLLNSAVSPVQQQRVKEKTRALKLYLMHMVWQEDWGPFEQFQLWAEGGGIATQSDAFKKAAAFFAYGQE